MDGINNNRNNYNIPFFGKKEDKPIMLDKTAKLNILVPKTKEVLCDIAEREVPENGQFRKVYVTFDVPETNNQAVLSIEHDAVEPKNQRRLSIGVHNKNSDRIISNFLKKGSKSEILEYLKDNGNMEQIIEAVNKLSNKTDDYNSTL